MSITIKETEKIAMLSRLDVNEEDKKILSEQLSDILKYIEKLNEANTDNVEPLAYIQPLSNVFREDILTESLSQETALSLSKNADLEKGCFYVPKVIE